jgi:hypothetical protein
MEVELSAISILQSVLGVPGSAFNPEIAPIAGDRPSTQSKQGTYGTTYYTTNALGKWVYLPVTVVYTNSSGAKVTYLLPNTAIEIDVVKHVIDTPVTERNGIVSELINIEAYKISIKGVVINKKSNELPESDLIALRDLFECNEPITIQNVMTDIYLKRPDSQGSRLATIRRKRVPYSVGVKHAKVYELELMSETPFNLTELSGK